MMLSRYLMLMGLVALGACGSSPVVNYYALDDGVIAAARGASPTVLVTSASVPEALDRPQMVVRAADSRLVLSEQQRWAEPLRAAIPRLVAARLGEALDSSGVLAVPAGAPQFDADFRLALHVQQFDVQSDGAVDLDLSWVLKPHNGKAIVGRSRIHEKAAEVTAGVTSTPVTVSERVAAQRRALGRAALEIAAEVRRHGGAR
ncbi:PqiC family protein [uncultured Propionivibrio sp.]|uniref:PqiC family protein n=1 Tax=uncultured Propionivibrio sp. TaxID=426737 RepID=UPI0029C019C1|nr:PqiC family protein [uncultured Propionivibrio sp.]